MFEVRFKGKFAETQEYSKKQFRIMLTQTEHDVIAAEADRLQTSKSNFMRKVLADYFNKQD